MDEGEICCMLLCAIPVVAIICNAVIEVFKMKYRKNNDDKD